MKSIAIPYARHLQTGETVDPSQVERGRAANVECLECGERLLARKGKKNVWHFAHEDLSNCSASGESILHFVAKNRLAEAVDRFLPAPDSGHLGRIRIKSGRTEVGIVGDKEGETVRRVDVTLGVEIPRSESDHLVYIVVEVNVTNRKDDDYIELLKKYRIPALEVDVPPDTGESLDKLDQILFESGQNWRWLNRTEAFLPSLPTPRQTRLGPRRPLRTPSRRRRRRR